MQNILKRSIDILPLVMVVLVVVMFGTLTIHQASADRVSVVNNPPDVIGWNQSFCDKMSNTGGSAAAANVCGVFSYNVSTNGTFDSVGAVGYAYDQIKEPAAAPSSGAMFNAGTVSGGLGWLYGASSTPIMETSVRIHDPQNSTTTSYYIGFTSTPTTGTFSVIPPGAGCFLIASSSIANWKLVSSNTGLSTTTVDTGIASSTNVTGIGAWSRWRISLSSTYCIADVQQGVAGQFTRVASIYTNVASTTGLNAQIYMITKSTGGLGNEFDFMHTHFWWKDQLPSL